MGTLYYREPCFKLPTWMGERTRKHGLARFFLKILEHVWEKEKVGAYDGKDYE